MEDPEQKTSYVSGQIAFALTNVFLSGFLLHMKHLTSMDSFPRQVHKKPIMYKGIQGSHCVPGNIALNDSNALLVVATPGGQQKNIHWLIAVPEFHCYSE
jgi:hypothetical protein